MIATATKKTSPSKPREVFEDRVCSIKLSLINLDHRNDRDQEAVRKEDLQALGESMELHGQQQPVGVVEKADGRYRLVFGHRRVAAANLMCWDEIQARVLKSGLGDDEIQEIRAVENLQRQDLNYVEEAFAVAGMIDSQESRVEQALTIADRPGVTARRDEAIKIVAKRIGKTEQWVRDRAFLSRASAKVRAFCRDGSLPFPHAREIVKLTSAERQDEVAELARAGRARWQGGKPDPLEPPMPIDELRKLVGKSLFSLAQVPWKLDVPFAGAMPCDRCTKNSANQTGLFEHAAPNKGTGYQSTYKEPAAGICTDAACFKAKETEHRNAVRAAASAVLKEAEGKKAPPAPEFIKPSQVTSEIKDRKARAKERADAAGKPAASKASASHGTHYTDKPGYKAKSKYDAALDKWSKSAKEAMRAQCKGDPILGLSLSLLSLNKAAIATQDNIDYTGKLKKTGKQLTPNACADIVARAIPMKTLAQLSVLAGEVEDTDVDLNGPQYDFKECRGVFEATCNALGIALSGPRPEFAEYLARETGSAAAKAANAAPKKSAKGSKGKKNPGPELVSAMSELKGRLETASKKGKASKSTDEEVDDGE